METNMRYIYREFLFRGFVPEHEFKRKKKFSYITSNRLIERIKFIYPLHCSVNYKYLQKGYPNPYFLIGDIGVEGFTKVEEKWKS